MTSRVGRVEDAGVAQLVEHFLAKEDVARSNRVTRSILLQNSPKTSNPFFSTG